MTLIITLSVLQYVQKNTGIFQGEEKKVTVNEAIDGFLGGSKPDQHVNKTHLGIIYKKMKDSLQSHMKKVNEYIDQMNRISVFSFSKTPLLNDFVKTLATIEFIQKEIKTLEFKIAQEYYRIERFKQQQLVAAEKKKKKQITLQSDQMKANLVLLQKIINVLDPEIVLKAEKYFDGLY